ncbi:hypothetical protein PABG_04262 [Paracoccidioides brasiliensis Pb03]|nr:hypothetical protein PABG_04262 [Paracoccidioides brasiliensis Pb03]
MPLTHGKKRGSGTASGEAQSGSTGRKYSISRLFVGQHRSREGNSPKDKNPSNKKEGYPPTSESSTSPSRPDNPRRVSGPSIYIPKPAVPAEVQEAYESATHLEEVSDTSNSLSENELKYIFSGAPHFLLEKGKRPQWYPHVIFPWDESTRIQNLTDRNPLQHPSFTLSTLHAHIPVSPENGGIQIYPDTLTAKHGSRRPSFDVGVFEIPNMLSSTAKEDGCIGFRNFMELPILYEPKPMQRSVRHRQFDKHLHLITGSNGKNEPYSDYRPNANLDRLKLIAEGPAAWKRIGVRDCSMETITERLQTLSNVQDQITLQGQSVTLLDRQSVSDLHRHLFSTFLYPPPNNVDAEHPDSFRFQISTLIQVLGIKGAWVDFSLAEWRTRAGQILWEFPPHQDGDCLNNVPKSKSSKIALLERKWLLMQILLSAEILFRADAAAKLRIFNQSTDIPVTASGIYIINGLRSDISDWGLIFCRRVFENLTFHYHPQADLEPATNRIVKEKAKNNQPTPSAAKSKEKQITDCIQLPRHPWQQLEALLVFAEILRWPDFEKMKHIMTEKLEAAFTDRSNLLSMFASPIRTEPLPSNIKPLGKCDMYRRSHTSNLIQLHDCSTFAGNSDLYFGGWISRTWLTGLVMPGESICDILISTLLENDPEAVKRLGPIANLYGAFIYKGRSWWSKACVVGRILASLNESSICMGWISTPVIPLDETGAPLGDGWLEIETINNIKNNVNPRINQGIEVLLDSSPLGVEGDLTATAFSLPLDEAHSGTDLDTHISYESSILSIQRSHNPSVLARPRKATAHLTFTLAPSSSAPSKITFHIKYNVSFISSFPCLPPYGYIAHPNTPFGSQLGRRNRHYHRLNSFRNEKRRSSHKKNDITKKGKPRCYSRLPGHPLHTDSFPYSYIPIHTLPSTPFPPTATPNPPPTEHHSFHFPTHYLSLATDRGPKREQLRQKHTYIIDARGSNDKELFARSWCAMVGVNAVVGRVKRTCMACCIREARAADVPIVIRVGRAAEKCSMR